MRVTIAAGGTGGHIFPGIAVAEQLEKRGVETTFVGSRKGLEQTLIVKEGYDLISLPIQGFLGRPVLDRLKFPLLLVGSFFLSIFLLARERPHAVVGFGGYAAFPVLLAARFLGIPTLISEQDSHPGLSTRILARLVNEVHLPTPQAAAFLGVRSKLSVSGNPLRRMISRADKALARRRFGLDEKVMTILIFGGSQGASSLNRAFRDCLSFLAERPKLQFIWMTGKRDYTWAAQAANKGFRVTVHEFIHEMGDAYSASDLVVSRAGGVATAEITAFGLPSILVPFPFATGGHQQVNAGRLAEAGAARLVRDEELTGPVLAREIASLASDERALREMGEKARLMGRSDGAERVANAIVRLAQSVRG